MYLLVLKPIAPHAETDKQAGPSREQALARIHAGCVRF
jgi:hypothetical protein